MLPALFLFPFFICPIILPYSSPSLFSFHHRCAAVCIALIEEKFNFSIVISKLNQVDMKTICSRQFKVPFMCISGPNEVEISNIYNILWHKVEQSIPSAILFPAFFDSISHSKCVWVIVLCVTTSHLLRSVVAHEIASCIANVYSVEK